MGYDENELSLQWVCIRCTVTFGTPSVVSFLKGFRRQTVNAIALRKCPFCFALYLVASPSFTT